MSKLSPSFKLRNYLIDIWRDDRKYFLGRVLTIIDASIADPEQRKGIKDLIQEVFYGNNYREESFREILLDYINKYSKDQFVTKEEEDGFLGRIGNTVTLGQTPGSPDYWN
jgi:hypothetical protein